MKGGQLVRGVSGERLGGGLRWPAADISGGWWGAGSVQRRLACACHALQAPILVAALPIANMCLAAVFNLFCGSRPCSTAHAACVQQLWTAGAGGQGVEVCTCAGPHVCP